MRKEEDLNVIRVDFYYFIYEGIFKFILELKGIFFVVYFIYMFEFIVKEMRKVYFYIYLFLEIVQMFF